MNLIDVTSQFATDEQCLAYLEQIRWPDGVRCPVCGNDKISRITRKSTTKNVRKSLYQCLEPTCKGQFSATSGTIFNDSHLPLNKWFMALALVVDAKKGISANQLKEHLGIGSYRTAWYMAHRIRKAMEDGEGIKLTGTVEIDETWIGGKAKRRGRARNQKPISEKFDMVIGLRERKSKEKPGRVKYVHIPDGKKESISKVIDKHVSLGAQRVITDSAAVYDFSINENLRWKHRKVNHSIQWVVPGSKIHTNTVESAFSLLKRGLIGSFHRVSIEHLHRYLSEFEYRFNARRAEDRFSDTLRRMMGIEPMPYTALIANPKTEV
ncbi:MAG: IS1595 family transposase [Silvibacterium sp.]